MAPPIRITRRLVAAGLTLSLLGLVTTAQDELQRVAIATDDVTAAAALVHASGGLVLEQLASVGALTALVHPDAVEMIGADSHVLAVQPLLDVVPAGHDKDDKDKKGDKDKDKDDKKDKDKKDDKKKDGEDGDKKADKKAQKKSNKDQEKADKDQAKVDKKADKKAEKTVANAAAFGLATATDVTSSSAKLPTVTGATEAATERATTATLVAPPAPERSIAIVDQATKTVQAPSTWVADEDDALETAQDVESDPGSLFNLTQAIGATQLWADGVTGEGIDVAVIDTGVTPTSLLASERVVAGATFPRASSSLDSRQDAEGHGTHLGSIIAGSDELEGGFRGVAPGARIVPVRIAPATGEATGAELLSAIDWVIANRATGGRNIRVMNLSVAADRASRPLDDVLAHAVTRAWDAGIVVVVAAGNTGTDTPLASPGYEPRVLTIGSLDHQGTIDAADDVPADYSAGSTSGINRPDLWAPGRSIPSALAPLSKVSANPDAVTVGTSLVRGTGTSQATAVVSGAVALLLSQRPELTPDQVATILESSAATMTVNGEAVERARLDLAAAAAAATPVDGPGVANQPIEGWSAATPPALVDETPGQSIEPSDPRWGMAFRNGADWSGARWVGARWVGARWVGAQWSEARWSGARWVGTEWVGARWVEVDWSGARWVETDWSGAQWAGAQWVGAQWVGAQWVGAQWVGAQWAGHETTD